MLKYKNSKGFAVIVTAFQVKVGFKAVISQIVKHSRGSLLETAGGSITPLLIHVEVNCHGGFIWLSKYITICSC